MGRLGAATAAFALALSAVGFPRRRCSRRCCRARRSRLRGRGGLEPPSWSFLAAQAVVGVTLGAYMQSEALTRAAHDWLPVDARQRGDARLSMGAGRSSPATPRSTCRPRRSG
jgi:hypothetical protein